jgi:hypothetical protein
MSPHMSISRELADAAFLAIRLALGLTLICVLAI